MKEAQDFVNQGMPCCTSNKPATWNEWSHTISDCNPDKGPFSKIVCFGICASVHRPSCNCRDTPSLLHSQRHRPLFWNGGQNGPRRRRQVVYLVPPPLVFLVPYLYGVFLLCCSLISCSESFPRLAEPSRRSGGCIASFIYGSHDTAG